MRAWDEFLDALRNELGSKTVEKWLEPLKTTRFDACNLYLRAPDSFYTVWFEEHIRPMLAKRLVNNNGKAIKVHLTLKKAEEAKDPLNAPQKIEPAQRRKPSLVFDELDKEATFDTYLTSQSNLLAYKLLLETKQGISAPSKEAPPLGFNPIYLFGKTGVGKTHLLMATARAMKEASLKVIYIRAETFTEHVVNAIRTGEMQAFRKSYRNVDALLIDDVQVFSRKGATQEELFHTFNALHTEGKQIILSANCPPKELKFIEPRLVSRFEWGIVIPLQPLGVSKMRELLESHAEKMQFSLSEEITTFLVKTFSSNTKSLLRALEALILRTHLKSSIGQPLPQPLPIETAKKMLGDLISEEEKSVLTPAKIIRTVAEHYGIKIDDILSKSQTRESVLPRQIAMHLCRHSLNLPYMKIGDLFSRDHSTVMSSVKLIRQNLEKKNQEILSPLNAILAKLDSL